MSKWTIAFIGALSFMGYFSYNCWQDEKQAIARASKAELDLETYKQENSAVKQIELNVIEAINNGQAKTDALRNDIDNGLVELRVKVETVERDSTKE